MVQTRNAKKQFSNSAIAVMADILDFGFSEKTSDFDRPSFFPHLFFNYIFPIKHKKWKRFTGKANNLTKYFRSSCANILAHLK